MSTMKLETLVQNHPPTPPSTGSEHHLVLQHIAQYNADQGSPYDEPRSIGPKLSRLDGVSGGVPSNIHRAIENPGLGIQFDSYGSVVEYNQNSQYDMGTSQAIFSPPTPHSTVDDDGFRRATRSSRTATVSTSPQTHDESPRPKATPRSRKPKAAKSDKTKTPKLTAPLSILTRELHHIPVKNMEEWVSRSADVRRKEAEKRNGYITRPMNSFMLYRSAYAERAKSWCLQNNHQVVSSVAGESWPLEPPEIRELYNEYAKIERINHQNAHPTYKFSPSKTAAPARKRKGEWSDDEEPSDLEDAEWAPSGSRSRSRSTKRLEQSIRYPHNGMNVDFFGHSYGANGTGRDASSWEMTNGGRPMPVPMDPYSQYYQTVAYPGMIDVNYEDGFGLSRVDAPTASMQFPTNHALLGLPGSASDIMQSFNSSLDTSFDERQLDPMLMAYDGRPRSDIDPTALQHYEYRNGQPHILDERIGPQDLDSPHDSSSRQEAYGWQPDPSMAAIEQESEFDKWMGVE